MPIRPEYIESPTTDLFIPDVVFRSNCAYHNVDFGEPCFAHEAMKSKDTIFGVCNDRALKTGFNGPIREASLRRNSRPDNA